jgi:hypothetical protein
MVHHIAVVNHSDRMDDRDVAFQVEAVRLQLLHHVAPLWDGEPPGVVFYGTAEGIPPQQAAVLGYVNDDGNAQSAGYHTDIGGLTYGLVDVGQSASPSATLSHESSEMYGNPKLDRKVPGPKGRMYYIELGDPTQEETYEIDVTLMGEHRRITVSDFVLPRWFDMPNTSPGDPRTTYLDQRLAPFEVAPGGYQIAEDTDGGVLFLSQGFCALRRSVHSRTQRIIARKYANLSL